MNAQYIATFEYELKVARYYCKPTIAMWERALAGAIQQLALNSAQRMTIEIVTLQAELIVPALEVAGWRAALAYVRTWRGRGYVHAARVAPGPGLMRAARRGA